MGLLFSAVQPVEWYSRSVKREKLKARQKCSTEIIRIMEKRRRIERERDEADKE